MGNVIQFPGKFKKEQSPTEVTFKDFAMQVLANDTEGAAKSLATLFSVPLPLALQCATAFQLKLQNDESLFAKTMEIREKLEKNETNNVLFLLEKCFGTSGPESLQLLHGLSARFKK